MTEIPDEIEENYAVFYKLTHDILINFSSFHCV